MYKVGRQVYINPLDYVPSGQSLDASHVQQAVLQAISQDGGSVVLPRGNYTFTQGVVLEGVTNLEIIFQPGAVVTFKNSNPLAVTMSGFSLVGCSGVQLKNPQITFQRDAGVTYTGIAYDGASKGNIISDYSITNADADFGGNTVDNPPAEAEYVQRGVNVKDTKYGAKGDWNGTTGTDDTTAISNAFDAIANGGTIIFTPGVYQLTSTITKTLNNVRIIGIGATLYKNFASTSLLNLTGTNIEIIGLSFDSDSMFARTVDGVFLYLDTITNLKVQNCNFSNCPSMNIVVRNGCQHVNISDCTFKNSKADGVQVANGGKYVIVANNTFENLGDDAISFIWYAGGTDYPENCLVIGNIIKGGAHRGVEVGSAKKISIIGNHISDTTESGVHIGLWDRTDFPEDVAINANTLRNCSTSYSNPTVMVANGTRVTVSNNIIDQPTEGIVIANFDTVKIHNNIIRGGRIGRAIHVFDAQGLNQANNLSITGNNIDGTMIEGMLLAPAPAGVKLTNVVITDNILNNLNNGGTAGGSINIDNADNVKVFNNKDFSSSNLPIIYGSGATNVTLRNNYPRGTNNYNTINDQIMGNGTTIPTTGTFKSGDIILNVTPIAGGFTGWVCVAGGSPGTWKTFGAITA